MQTYIGTKLIKALPMTRKAYNDYRGWELPADENGDDDGFLVEYLDGGKSNHPNHEGYISWSPKDVFERAYRPTSGLTFGMAIKALKAGKRVARAGWNGKGMWLQLQLRSVLPPNPLPYIEMKTSDNRIVPWPVSQTDILAEDWQIIE